MRKNKNGEKSRRTAEAQRTQRNAETSQERERRGTRRRTKEKGRRRRPDEATAADAQGNGRSSSTPSVICTRASTATSRKVCVWPLVGQVTYERIADGTGPDHHHPHPVPRAGLSWAGDVGAR